MELSGTCTGFGDGYYRPAELQPKPCPTCGSCPTCGRVTHVPAQTWTYPTSPTWITTSGTFTGTMPGPTYTINN